MTTVRRPELVFALALLAVVLNGCFVADAPARSRVACASVDDCPPSHRCELTLGRCLPAEETVPRAAAIDAATAEDEAIDVVLQGDDADGDDLVFHVTPPDPSEGALGEVDGATVKFTPAPDFSGTATFSYVVEDDAGLLSLPATVTLDVVAVDDAPYFVAPATLVAEEDQQLQINVDLFDREATGRDAETLQVIDVDTVDIAVSVEGAHPEAVVTQQPDGDIVYLPPPDFFGSDDISITARCGDKTATYRLEIVVAPVNDPPTVDVADLATQEGEPVERLLDLFDPDDAIEDLVVEVGPLAEDLGAVEIVGEGAERSLRFTPAPGRVGDTTFTVGVRDVAGAQAERKVDVHVFETVAAPGARSASVEVDEDDVVIVDLAELSSGPAGLSWDVQAAPLHGVLDVRGLASGQVTYRPAADFFGADRFVYSVSAPGSGVSVAAAIDLAVVARPDEPRAGVQTLSVPEDEILDGVLAATDVDGDPLTATVTLAPLHGRVTLDGLAFRYVPTSNFAGRELVELLVDDDGDGVGATARLTIDVLPVGDPPTADGFSATAREDVSTTIDLRGSSVDAGAALAFEIVASPAHGTLVGLDEAIGRVAYVPTGDYAGDDGFDFRVRSSGGTSAAAHVDVVVLSEPDAPTLAPLAPAVVVEDGSVSVPVFASDADGDAVTVELTSAPRRGTATVQADGTILYVPHPDANGADVVGLRPRDATDLLGELVELHVDILAVPDAPQAFGRDVPLVEDGSASFSLTGASVDGETLHFELVEGPAHGTVPTFSDAGDVVYAPAADFAGTDALRFLVRDDRGLVSTPATVTLRIAAAADAPRLAARPPFPGTEDTPFEIEIPATDPDGDLVDVTLSAPTRGALTRVGPRVFSYAPTPNVFGDDVIVATATDATGASTTLSYTVRIAPVPDAPTAVSFAVDGREDQTVLFALLGASVDGDAVRFFVEAQPDSGQLASFNATTGSAVYVPPPDFAGTATFSYRAVNASGLFSAAANVLIHVAAVNDAPILTAPPPVVTLEDLSVNLRVDAFDPDVDDAADVVVVLAPSHGALEFESSSSPARFKYSPAANFNGSDLFVLRAVDKAAASSNDVVVTVDVVPVPDPPVAAPLALNVVEDGAVPFSVGGSTVDGGALGFAIVRPPARGTIDGFVGTTGAGTYRPNADQNGGDTFTFVAVDARGVRGEEATVTVDIAPANDLPTVAPRSVVTAEDLAVDVPIAVVDVDGDPTAIEIVSNGGKGTATFNAATSTLRYVPRANVNGSDTVVVAARDATGLGPSATISLFIAPVPDPPRVESVEATGLEDVAILVQLVATSADAEAVTFSLVTQPSSGTFDLFDQHTGLALYRGAANFNGTDSFVFSARTATQTGTFATATIRVLPVNDAPTVAAPTVVADVGRGGTVASPDLVVSDVDAEPVGLLIVQPPTVGSASVEAGRIVYQAPPPSSAGFVGTLTVGVVAIDAAGAASPRVDVPFRIVVDDDCATLRNSGVTASGVYAINHVASRCDMTADGGGWTMVAKIADRWRYDDQLWTDNQSLNEDDLDPLPAIDAKLTAWRFLPPPDAIRVETFDIDLRNRQRIVLDVSGSDSLLKLFNGNETTTTSAGVAAWRATFAPQETNPNSHTCIREGANITKELFEGVACRLCAIGGTEPSPGAKCTEPVQAYGLGVDVPLSLNAGAAGEFHGRRRAVIWVRSTDFTQSFPSEKSCEAHAERGRVLSGLYRVEEVPTFCAF